MGGSVDVYRSPFRFMGPWKRYRTFSVESNKESQNNCRLEREVAEENPCYKSLTEYYQLWRWAREGGCAEKIGKAKKKKT